MQTLFLSLTAILGRTIKGEEVDIHTFFISAAYVTLASAFHFDSYTEKLEDAIYTYMKDRADVDVMQRVHPVQYCSETNGGPQVSTSSFDGKTN
jgi:hypothetical protein